MPKFLKKIVESFKKGSTFQKILMVVGFVIGIPLAIAGLIAAIGFLPVTAPLWLLILLGIGLGANVILTIGSYTALGKYIGIAIDTVREKVKPNNEKVGTVVGFIVGVLFAIVASIAAVTYIPQISAAIALILLEAPLLVGSSASSISTIAKLADHTTDKTWPLETTSAKKSIDETKTILADTTGKIKEILKTKSKYPVKNIDDKPKASIKNHESNAFNFIDGIKEYLNHRNDDKNVHWITTFFDSKRGVCRATIYFELFNKATTILNNAASRSLRQIAMFQQQVIIYSLLAGYNDGSMLQEKVYKQLGYNSLHDARAAYSTAIKEKIGKIDPSRIKELNKTIGSIVKSANTKQMKLDHQEYLEKIGNLLRPRNHLNDVMNKALWHYTKYH